MLTSLLFVFLMLAPDLAAQRTWIVDRNNGPGTDFTDLPAAVAAAAAGDIIRIRPAPGLLYEAPAIIDNKPLSILGDHTRCRHPLRNSFRCVDPSRAHQPAVESGRAAGCRRRS